MADKAYFKKEFLHVKVKLSTGKVVEWEVVGNQSGVLEADTASVISDLKKAAGKFGVSVITKAEYDELKKNSATALQPKPEWQPSVTGKPPQKRSSKKSKTSSPAAAKPAPKAEAEPEASETPKTQTGAVE